MTVEAVNQEQALNQALKETPEVMRERSKEYARLHEIFSHPPKAFPTDLQVKAVLGQWAQEALALSKQWEERSKKP